ncbi:MAG: hypothetical protein F9K18_02030 [Thermoanaerobaculia bacterium]|nr:MAG: hypothetical protein F9K18_02030 [Thermoanaerobaculia bacterium]
MADHRCAESSLPSPSARTRGPAAALPVLLAGLLSAALAAPATAQLAPAEATIFRLAVNEDLALGSALVAGDFNGDGEQDLAMGAPLATNGGHASAGVVLLRYASGDVHFLMQSTSGLAVAEGGDQFGAALAAGDLDCDGYDDLAVGIRWEDVGNALDTGAVLVYYGSAGGLPQAAGDLLLLDDVDTGNQNFAAFGFALAILDYGTATELAVSAPGHDIPSAVSSGAVYVVPHTCPGGGFQTASTLRLVQGVGGVVGMASDGDALGSALAAGDYNGDGRADLAVGVPGNSYGGDEYGGIHVFYGAPGALAVAGNAVWYQDDPGVPGVAEDGDRFGAAVAAGDFDGDGFDDLAAGVPGEDVGALADAGGVNVLYGSAAGLTGAGSQYFDQDTPGVTGVAEALDHFGEALATGDFSGNGRADLAIGAPGENVGVFADAGTVNVFYGTGAGLSVVHNQGFTENELPPPAAPANSEFFGGALAAIDLDGDGLVDLAAAAPYDRFNGFPVGLVAVVPGRPLFVDGFESGDTARWSLTLP